MTKIAAISSISGFRFDVAAGNDVPIPIGTFDMLPSCLIVNIIKGSKRMSVSGAKEAAMGGTKSCKVRRRLFNPDDAFLKKFVSHHRYQLLNGCNMLISFAHANELRLPLPATRPKATCCRGCHPKTSPVLAAPQYSWLPYLPRR